jgi:hypothetical protein
MQMEEGGVWNSGMMWRNDGKMDGWHYANSLWIVKLRRLPDRHGFLNGCPAPTIDRNSHHADTHHPQPGLLVCRRVFRDPFPALFDPVWWQTHRQVVGSSIGRGVTWFVKDESVTWCCVTTTVAAWWASWCVTGSGLKGGEQPGHG